jgi:hypothetical protein
MIISRGKDKWRLCFVFLMKIVLHFSSIIDALKGQTPTCVNTHTHTQLTHTQTHSHTRKHTLTHIHTGLYQRNKKYSLKNTF